MIDFIPDEIDFSDEKQREYLQNKINSTLSLILSTERYTMEMLEKILFVSQSWIQPLIDQTLNLESLHMFSNFKNAFSYILEQQNAAVERPYSKLEIYCEICNSLGGIFGEDDESIHLSQEELDVLRDGYFTLLKQTKICAIIYTAYYSLPRQTSITVFHN